MVIPKIVYGFICRDDIVKELFLFGKEIVECFAS